jgi:hypothetical protein
MPTYLNATTSAVTYLIEDSDGVVQRVSPGLSVEAKRRLDLTLHPGLSLTDNAPAAYQEDRISEDIAGGAAEIEIETSTEDFNNHAITVKVLDGSGDEAQPAGGAAAIAFKVHEDDEYQALMDDNGDAVEIDLENGPWTVSFELPVSTIKITGSTLGANASMVVTWSAWKE